MKPPEPTEPMTELELLRLAELAELGVMTASLLHELRQPLFAVKGRLQLARHARRPLDPDEVEALLQNVDHVEQLIEHYAGLTRPEDTWIEVDLRDEVARAIGMLAHRARQGRVEIASDLDEQVLLVRGRPVAVRQVVLNLVGNAVDAVSGRPEAKVVVRARIAGRVVRLEVLDNGPGIAPEVVHRLFQPFVTTKGPGRGTGLGLYIARRLAEEVGGTVHAEPGPSGGARLTVHLPIV
ncbi:MAG: HAMP domain-containing sensor histidine kinase [Myxococcota bacterium]